MPLRLVLVALALGLGCAHQASVGFTAEQDLDEDGLPDRVDNCPKQRGGSQNSGCPFPQRVSLRPGEIALLDKVYFTDTDPLGLEPASESMLREVAALLQRHPWIREIVIESHTHSEVESPGELTTQRATLVRELLVSAGARTTILAVGLGDSRPLDPGDTPTARAANNRIAVRF